MTEPEERAAFKEVDRTTKSSASRRRKRVCSLLWLRHKQVHSQPVGQELGDELSLDAIAGLIERRGKRTQTAFSRRYGDDPAADSALARQANVIEPFSGSLVQSRGSHHGECVMAHCRINQPLFGERIYAAVGQSGAHNRQVLGAYVQRALLGI